MNKWISAAGFPENEYRFEKYYSNNYSSKFVFRKDVKYARVEKVNIKAAYEKKWNKQKTIERIS